MRDVDGDRLPASVRRSRRDIRQVRYKYVSRIAERDVTFKVSPVLPRNPFRNPIIELFAIDLFLHQQLTRN
jgi:hypothetical protein